MPRIKYYDVNSGTWKYADKVINGSSGQGYSVQFVKQGLNLEQMAQARENIGAASQEEVSEIVDEVLGSGALLKTTDVVDNLTTEVNDKPLSANQGKKLDEAIALVSEVVESLGGTVEQISSVIEETKDKADNNFSQIEQLTQVVNQLSDIVEELKANSGYTYGTEDLIAGTSPLETGKLHFVYE